ncbi:hypothetical protein LCGC14_0698960 [marine sediment metagenome]|uniref:Uncharacterized protein n=1 Tax=marine sediment metagenome TaxID=412755 RepID=A0A0F9R3U4_9ZZZZ
MAQNASQAKPLRCRCGGLGSPEIIDPCIRELVDCLNRHGVETLASCCGHGEVGDVVLSMDAVEPNIVASGEQTGWTLRLAPKPVVIPYDDEAMKWAAEYPTGGKGADEMCPIGAIDQCPTRKITCL